ncbi:terminase small subunit-like protein [Commensalibacter communis]|uniref:terminase small subunit-like protein n=1 Tax=Commensalibacter communis TaxID=2972786 RepID=UPI0022FF8940|nr:hypothetical protein [Commensalibacter communis]CAI3960945.1 unnamed protein product [Commensalibacter communis]
MTTGRPSLYSGELVTIICDKIANGQSLRSICNEKDMPTVSTIMRWLNNKPEFCQQYTRAREMQADSFFDEAVEIIHGEFKDNIEVQAAKLKLDAIKWTAGKLAPKKYGEYKQIDANVNTIKKLEDMTEDELTAFVGQK